MAGVRVAEGWWRGAVRRGKAIASMATRLTQVAATEITLHRVAREMGREIVVVDVLVEGAFGWDQEAVRERMMEYAQKVYRDVDVILFAQGSMAYCEQYIADKTGKPVLSSPRFGAKALRDALVAKGVL